MACEGRADSVDGATAAAAGSVVTLVTGTEPVAGAGAAVSEGIESEAEAGVCDLLLSLGLSIPAPSDLPEST